MLGGLTNFSVRFFKELFLPPYEIEQIRKHMIELGMKTLPIVGVTGFIIGLVIAMQLSPVLKRFGAEAFLPGSVGISIVRELGPVICALIFAGRGMPELSNRVYVILEDSRTQSRIKVPH